MRIFFTLCARSDFGKNFCIVSTHTKRHVEAKKSPFWIFHRGHDVSVSLPYCVKSFSKDVDHLSGLQTIIAMMITIMQDAIGMVEHAVTIMFLLLRFTDGMNIAQVRNEKK